MDQPPRAPCISHILCIVWGTMGVVLHNLSRTYGGHIYQCEMMRLSLLWSSRTGCSFRKLLCRATSLYDTTTSCVVNTGDIRNLRKSVHDRRNQHSLGHHGFSITLSHTYGGHIYQCGMMRLSSLWSSRAGCSFCKLLCRAASLYVTTTPCVVNAGDIRNLQKSVYDPSNQHSQVYCACSNIVH